MPNQTLTGYPSIDKPWLKYYENGVDLTPFPECTIYDFLFENNKKHLKGIAMLYFGKKITYKQFFNEITKTEKALLQNGIKYGDNITICMPAIPETYYLILALNKIGANANLLNPTFTESQLLERISETNSKILFVVNELYNRVENIVSKSGIEKIITCPAVNSLGFFVKKIKKVKNIENTVSWNAFIKEGKHSYVINDYKYKKDTSAITVYSSGTTGASKGIVHTNESVNCIIQQYRISGFPVERGKRYFSQIPIWFSTGIIVTMLVPLVYGITIIPVPIYNFKLFGELIEKYNPNYMVTAAGLIEYLKDNFPIYKPCENFKVLAVGGDYMTSKSEISTNEWLKLNNSKNELFKGYGMCECGGTVTTSSKFCNKIGSAGIPLPQMIVAAFDIESGRELKYGERGELRVITPGHMQGYYKNHKATNDYFYKDEHGNIWACTGDMGYVDNDGNVYVCGRISDSYRNDSQELIYLFDIERTIADNKNVKQCKVISVELNGKLEHIANVVLSNSEPDVFKEILSECKIKLPKNHLPRYFKIYENALPVAPSGKLDTLKMKENLVDLIEL